VKYQLDQRRRNIESCGCKQVEVVIAAAFILAADIEEFFQLSCNPVFTGISIMTPVSLLTCAVSLCLVVHTVLLVADAKVCFASF
jgi:hypothetical protein